ncbi:hypothetical protein NMY22_g6644 [Coprinellus aureogranulatus]|nr:hypothetical protein NMY22_g6644 [Coprinellus aureogranulatus]
MPQVNSRLSKRLVLLQEDSLGQKAGSGGSSPRREEVVFQWAHLTSLAPLQTLLYQKAGFPTVHQQTTLHLDLIHGVIQIGLVVPQAPPAPGGKPPPGRDPKSRARSRDYLKQCLQEISYLTSPQAMNPLPNRPIIANPAVTMAIPSVPSFESMPYNGRPRKLLPETSKEFPILNGMNKCPSAAKCGAECWYHPSAECTPSVGIPSVVDREGEPENSGTAIFRPGDDWKEKLRQSHEDAQNRSANQVDSSSDVARWAEDGELREDETGVEDEDSIVEGEGAKSWKPKKTLRNHLDAVRAVAFHPTELCLATGGDDCTVKFWRMEVSALASSNARPTTEAEPQLMLRRHSAAITRLIHSPSKGLLYSASLDLSIRVWALPSPSHTTYAPYDETRSRGEPIGHSDAVWDLALVRDESTLISRGADGAVKVWDVSGPSGGGSLKLTWGWNGDVENHDDPPEETSGPGATAVEVIRGFRADLRKVAVAYQNSVVKIFEIETGKEVSRLNSDISYDGTPATQINCVISHPTMPILVTSHEDKFIRIFDLTTGMFIGLPNLPTRPIDFLPGQCTHSMLAHLDGAFSLSIDAARFSLTCVQEREVCKTVKSNPALIFVHGFHRTTTRCQHFQLPVVLHPATATPFGLALSTAEIRILSKWHNPVDPSLLFLYALIVAHLLLPAATKVVADYFTLPSIQHVLWWAGAQWWGELTPFDSRCRREADLCTKLPTASQEFFTTSWDFASAAQWPTDDLQQDNEEETAELRPYIPPPLTDDDIFPEIANPRTEAKLPFAKPPAGSPSILRPPKNASGAKSPAGPPGKNAGSSRRRGVRREAKKLAAEAAKAAQIERLGNVALTHHFKDSTIRKYTRPTAIFTTAASTSAQDFPHSAGGSWVGPRDAKGKGVPWTLKELEELGYEYVPYVKGRNVFFVDASGIIIGGLIDCPSSADWTTVIEEAGRSLSAARSLATRHGAFPKQFWVHRRGSYLSLSVGVSMGGGQKRPGVLVHRLLIRRKIARSLLRNEAIKRVAGYQSSAFAFVAPRVFRRYTEDLGRLFESDDSLEWNFTNSIFPACGFNCGPQCVTVDHFDHANLSWGLCVVTPFGRFDHRKGGHLILHGLKKVIEFPSGTSAAFPSATLKHSNTPIQPGEERTSMTQFAAGGLFRWVSYGFQTSKTLSATESGRAFRDEVNGEDGSRWAEGISLFSTVDTWASDLRTLSSPEAVPL